MRDGFANIPLSADPTEGQLIFGAWRRGDIPDDEYFLMNAQLTFAHINKEKAIQYPPLSNDLQQYVNGRLLEGEYDQRLGTRLGAWTAYIVQSLDHNVHSLEHLQWCLSKVEAKGMDHEAGIFKAKMSEFSRLQVPVVFEKALKVQKMDAVAREMESRR